MQFIGVGRGGTADFNSEACGALQVSRLVDHALPPLALQLSVNTKPICVFHLISIISLTFQAIMAELLSAIELVPTKRNEFLSTPPRNSISASAPLPASSRAAEDAKSSSSLQIPIDLEDGTLKEGRIIVIIAALTGVNFLCSLSNGFITIGLPKIASDLSLPQHLMLWPAAVP
jgi:hypothetical protein